ncbi:MAG: hypothetical protein JO252_17620 [Planctomycetaceae bacterium]|nr:hypothetical protein [Planctomycetaceae bacterium]
MRKDMDARLNGKATHVSRWLARLLVLPAVALSGGMTTAAPAQDGRWAFSVSPDAAARSTSRDVASMSEPVRVFRLQSPTAGAAAGDDVSLPPTQPPLPDPRLPPTTPVTGRPPAAPAASTTSPTADPSASAPAAGQPPAAPASAAPATTPIATVPAAGRPPAATSSGGAARRTPPAQGSGSAAGDSPAPDEVEARRATPSPAGPTASHNSPALQDRVDPQSRLPVRVGPTASRDSPALQGLSSIAKNRAAYQVEPEEEQKLQFPNICDDPLAKSGVPEDQRDPYLFPWLVNLFYEDRWRLEDDPVKARAQRRRRQAKIDIRDPDPDTANFPNSAFTLPKGRLYIENSPVGLYGKSSNQPRVYQWEFLTRYGLTDNLEFRIFSNGLTAQGYPKRTTGFSPLAFDFKMHFSEENTKYHIPAMGVEIYLLTPFGSPAFNAGTQPSMNLLFDQSLPLDIGFEYNLGISGVRNALGLIHYQFTFQWAFQREVVKDFDIFVQGFYNEAALPRVIAFRRLSALSVQHLISQATIPSINVVGVGGIRTINDRLAVFGSYSFGTTGASPRHIALLGFAVAF